MMNYKGWEIPEGKVIKVEDAARRVIWSVQNDKPVILEVEKITADTYVSSSTYTGEKFILLDIYPKTNGTVKVTYGGVTKTITDTSGVEEPNAQQVYFGTFGGKSDDTPDSGTVTISGDYRGVAVGTYKRDKAATTQYCGCIKNIVDLGDVSYIPDHAFHASEIYGVTVGMPATRQVVVPQNVTYIGLWAFNYQYKSGSTQVTRTYLEELVMLPTTPPTLYQRFYPYFDTFKIVVPAGCGEVYKTADVWSENADYIVEAS